MKKIIMPIFLILLALLSYQCKDDTDSSPLPGTTPIPASEQRTGNASDGYDYLVYGNYVGSGIPYGAYSLAMGAGNNLLNRTGDNASIPYDFTAVDASNGVRVVAANCLQCHAQTLNGEFIVGLGTSLWDFTADQSTVIPAVDLILNTLYGNDSPEVDAYTPFRRAILATGPQLVTDVVGANPADKLAVVLAAHRNKDDLSWVEEPALPIPSEVVPTDVPAWWLLKKKNAMFYNAVGRGDFARIMMASSLLTMTDSSEARVVDNHFADVLAFINSIEAPVFTETLDNEKITRGQAIFEGNCSKCHGTYGNDESYPNLLVDLDVVGTDPVLAQSNFAYTDFIDWYNSSWFSKAPYAAEMVPGNGYIAPPLDGIWATAPYFHNGSVPDLASLLNSSERPTYWKRTLESNDYNMERVGWNYLIETSNTGSSTYDTTLMGYGNEGHTFGDTLSDEERSDLIEYLKGL